MNKLKEINGKYYQECEVVMLATDKATWPNCIWLGRFSNQLRLDTSYNNKPKSISPIDDSMLPQHLYFLSNEKIKEGDWFMNHQYMIEEGKEEYAIWRCGDITPNSNPKKIIATTDLSLGIPQPSKEFIQAYIKSYNDSNQITNMLVEYKKCYNQPIDENYEKFGDLWVSVELKVNSSNEITIKKIKDSYTREELPSILQSYLDYCLFSGYITPMKFIEENL